MLGNESHKTISAARANTGPRHGRSPREKVRRIFERQWTRLLYGQLAAYVVVLLLWLLPIPNPVKVFAVAFHEMSHALAALLTGGRVFGFAIDPGGAGVTIGIGGSMPLILFAGYIGSCVWGALVFYVSVRWQARHSLLGLMVILFCSTLLGWLNASTIIFGLGSLFLLLLTFWLPHGAQLFFVRLVGSASCLYAPLEVIGEFFQFGGAPSVFGKQTPSDVAQLAELMMVPRFLVAAIVLAIQAAILVVLVRWTCDAGARATIRRAQAARRRHMQVCRELRANHPVAR